MYKENYMESLRSELVELIAEKLTPLSLEYGYSDVPLESNIKWRPQILILGNYSSGKSTLINELLGGEIQKTGQAPTDDSFTIITHEENSDTGDKTVQTQRERDGKALLNDPEYPFEILKKHGQRFSSHFRIKYVNSPFLQNLAIIDTPGMLDSVAELDRGYNYQEVIGDMAQIADLILVLFDPHKAGTVRETYNSLRRTLPAATFEDRLIFVLNRVDECSNLIDLIKVYGTLCWNLSQMTGRKDIPEILMTYSSEIKQNIDVNKDLFLNQLGDQRKTLKDKILQTPKFRLDNLASYFEVHGERLNTILLALLNYKKLQLKKTSSTIFTSFIAGLIFSSAAYFYLQYSYSDYLNTNLKLIAATTVFGFTFFIILATIWLKFSHNNLFHHITNNIDELARLNTKTEQDNWHHVSKLVKRFLQNSRGRYSRAKIKLEYNESSKVCKRGSVEIRSALNEIEKLKE